MRRYIEQTTQPDGTVTETPVDGIILTEREYQEQRDQLDSLMDTYKAQRPIDRTYLKAFGLEDDPQSETILP